MLPCPGCQLNFSVSRPDLFEAFVSHVKHCQFGGEQQKSLIRMDPSTELAQCKNTALAIANQRSAEVLAGKRELPLRRSNWARSVLVSKALGDSPLLAEWGETVANKRRKPHAGEGADADIIYNGKEKFRLLVRWSS
jgi:hypothetical protein